MELIDISPILFRRLFHLVLLSVSRGLPPEGAKHRIWEMISSCDPSSNGVHHTQKSKQQLGPSGVLAINNAVGWKLLEREEVDAMVQKRNRGGDAAGNYSVEPLRMALKPKGHRLIKVRGKGHMWLASQKVGRYLVLGWHISYDRSMHFIAVDADANLVIDGAKKTMMKLDVGGILVCLSYGVHRIWKID